MEGEVEEINDDDAFGDNNDDDDCGSSPLPARITVNNRKEGKKEGCNNFYQRFHPFNSAAYSL